MIGLFCCLVTKLYPTLLRTHGLQPTRLLCPWDFPGKNTAVGCHLLLQRIFPTLGLNPGIPHCRQMLYCLSHQGSHTMLLNICIIINYPPNIPSAGEGNGNPLQHSCLENPMDRGAWQAVVHGVAKSQTGLRDFTFTFHFHALEKEMATHSSVLAWRIPGTEEPGGLPSMGLH